MTTTKIDSYRLPYDVAPRRYNLHLAPDLEAATFTGTVEIEVEVLSSIDRIEMNAIELEIESAELRSGWSSAGDTLSEGALLEISFDEDEERVLFSLSAPIAPGNYTVVSSFTGALNDKLRGFYPSRFVDTAGTERVIATTQFEDTDARRAFPCFDEPDRKAVYSVTLDAPAGMLAISNGPEIGTEQLADGATRVRFGDTIPMSTYLVAFIVGPLEATDPVDVDGTALRIVHVPGKGHLCATAIDAAAHALRFYTEYFAIAYPAEKLDLIAIPDFAAGAMENLGCVTFREVLLLADPDNASQPELERLVEVIDHEIAHMWFGDLVTMRWWNGIWLNEAFATFMSLCCEDDYRPEWQIFTSFARSKGAALAIDGLHNTRPIEFPVRRPSEAAAMFDVLTYEKGASVLWMIEQYLGRDRFRAGVRRYLAQHKLGNTETGDLWDAIEAEAGNVPIREVMDSWIFQGGYPLVCASVSTAPATEGQLELSQESFSYLPEQENQETDSAIGRDWLVPVLVGTTGSARVDRALLHSDAVHLDRRSPTIVNAGGAGFYRLSYDATLRGELLDAIESLAPLERFNLVADTWATVLAERTSLGAMIEVIDRLSAERDPFVWSTAIGALRALEVNADDATKGLAQTYAERTLAPHLKRLGWERVAGEDEQSPVMRAALIGALGTFGNDEDVVEKAIALFRADHAGDAPLDADIASAVLSITAAHATAAEFESILERHRHPKDPMDEVRHLNCLAALTDVELAGKVHALCLSEIRSQNAPYLLGAMLANPAIGPSTWNFIASHYDELTERFPENSATRMLEGVSGLSQLDANGEPLYENAVHDFVRSHNFDGRARLVMQSLERLAINIRFARYLRDEGQDVLANTAN